MFFERIVGSFLLFAVLYLDCMANVEYWAERIEESEEEKESENKENEEDKALEDAFDIEKIKEGFIAKRLSEGASQEEVQKEVEGFEQMLKDPKIKKSFEGLKQSCKGLKKTERKIKKIDEQTRKREEKNARGNS